jgi:hypothetical protein
MTIKVEMIELEFYGYVLWAPPLPDTILDWTLASVGAPRMLHYVPSEPVPFYKRYTIERCWRKVEAK